jgi:hypothetical protein
VKILTHDEIRKLQFHDDSVREVVLEAVGAGEARVIQYDDGNCIYDDPYFSNTQYNISELRYDSEIGLHTE